MVKPFGCFMEKKDTTEEKIIFAAQKVFTKKGMAGARMQEIADEAGINKAMLHYYFRNKEKLFRKIFENSIRTLMGELGHIIESDLPFFDKIKKIIDTYVDILTANPSLPIFILSEINQNPEFIERLFNENLVLKIKSLLKQVQQQVDAGNIHPVNPIQLLINIISMVVFPFAARPMIQKVVANNVDGDFDLIISNRKKEIFDFVSRALKNKLT